MRKFSITCESIVTRSLNHNLSGPRPRRQGRQRPEWPVRARDPPAGQEASTGDQDQEEDAQPKVERDVLLRGWGFYGTQ